MASCVKSKSVGQFNTKYCILVTSFRNAYSDNCFQVIFTHDDHSVSCSCNKFEKWGVLCGHALKVLDIMEIKLLPEKYIIRRWTRQARSSNVEDVSGRIIIENPKLDVNQRYQILSRTLLRIAARAADFEETSILVFNASNLLYKQVEEKMGSLTMTSGDGAAPYATSDLNLASDVDNLMKNSTQSALTLKKKECKRSGKRCSSWVEELSGGKKGAKKNMQNPSLTSISNSFCEEVDKTETIGSLAGQNDQISFTEMLMGTSIVDFSEFHPTEEQYLNQGSVGKFPSVAWQDGFGVDMFTN